MGHARRELPGSPRFGKAGCAEVQERGVRKHAAAGGRKGGRHGGEGAGFRHGGTGQDEGQHDATRGQGRGGREGAALQVAHERCGGAGGRGLGGGCCWCGGVIHSHNVGPAPGGGATEPGWFGECWPRVQRPVRYGTRRSPASPNVQGRLPGGRRRFTRRDRTIHFRAKYWRGSSFPSITPPASLPQHPGALPCPLPCSCPTAADS